MPEMDGLEATRLIRAMGRPDAKSIPIIALTANAFDEGRIGAFFRYAPRPALRLRAGFGWRFAESHILSLPSADA